MKFTRKEIEAKVNGVILDKLFVEEEDCKPDARLTFDLGADSLDVVDVLMSLERKFSVRFTDEETDRFANCSVSDICDMIESKL